MHHTFHKSLAPVNTAYCHREKEYLTFLKAQRLEPHHRMQFNGVLKTLVGVGSYSSA